MFLLLLWQLHTPVNVLLILCIRIYNTSVDENHLCGASLRESHKIRHAHGIDYHHMHQRHGMHGAGTPEYSSMSVWSSSVAWIVSEWPWFLSKKLPREWRYRRLLVVQWCWSPECSYSSLHVMTITSPSTCTKPGDKPPCSHHHVHRSISDVNCGPEPCQRGPALTFQFHAFARSVAKLSFRSCAVWVYVYALDDHYLRVVKILTLSSLKWSPHKRTRIYTYKTASCLSCIRGLLRLAPNYIGCIDTSTS
jgi:hypothetical protein